MDYGPFDSILVQHKTFLCFRMDVIIKLIAKRLAWETYVVPGLQQAEMCGSRRGGISGGVGGGANQKTFCGGYGYFLEQCNQLMQRGNRGNRDTAQLPRHLSR